MLSIYEDLYATRLNWPNNNGLSASERAANEAGQVALLASVARATRAPFQPSARAWARAKWRRLRNQWARVWTSDQEPEHSIEHQAAAPVQ